MENVLVIGASRGIGAQVVRDYVAKGANVFYTVRAGIDCVASGKATQYVADITCSESLIKLRDELRDVKLSKVVVVSGIFIHEHLSHENITVELLEELEAGFMRSYKVNSVGPLKAFIVFSPLMKAGAHFAVLTTCAASMGDNTIGGHYSYRSSKSGLNAIMKNLTFEEVVKSKSLSICLLHPGWVQTDMTRGTGPVTIPESSEKIVETIEGWKPFFNGEFIHAITGEILPW